MARNRLRKAYLTVSTIGIAVLAGLQMLDAAMHKEPFRSLEFNQVVQELAQPINESRTATGEVVLPRSQRYLTKNGCVYVTVAEKGRWMVFFPTDPWTWGIPPVRYLDGYVYSNRALTPAVDGNTLTLHSPGQTPVQMFRYSKMPTVGWYHVAIIHD